MSAQRAKAVNDPLRYTANIDMRNVNDSHTFAIAAVPGGSDVLDVGAADGSVAQILGQMGCRVWGVEYDPDAAKLAEQWCEGVAIGDVEQIDLHEAFDRRFDVILFLDILEHIKDPLTVLRNSLDALSERGYVVISLPNVAHASMRAQLLGGHFSYTPTGLLDETHLRFFDPTSVYQFLDDAGLVVIDESRVTFPIDGTEIAVHLNELDPSIVEKIASDDEADSYQFLFMAAPKGSPVITHPPFLPIRTLQRELRSVRQQLEELELLVGVRGGLNRSEMTQRLKDLLQSNRQRRHALRSLVESMNEGTERLLSLIQNNNSGS